MSERTKGIFKKEREGGRERDERDGVNRLKYKQREERERRLHTRLH